MVRVGIVGCGNIGKVHGYVLQQMQQVQIVAFADQKVERAFHYAKTYGTEHTGHYASLTEMLEKETIDVLHICTPHDCHVPMAKEALEGNIHVFMEKPPAISRKEFLTLKKVKEQSGKNVGVCFQNRYNGATEKILELLESRALGEVKGARAFVTWNRQAGYYEESGWRGTWKKEGGGVLINQAIHTLDLLVYLLGKPEDVEASMENHHLKNVIEVEDTVEAYMTFPFGNACFYATNAFAEDSLVLLEIVCENGKMRMEGNCLEVTDKDGEKKVYDFTKPQNWEGKSYWGHSHQACICDFYKSLAEGVAYRNSLESVEDTFELVMKIYENCKDKMNLGGR